MKSPRQVKNASAQQQTPARGKPSARKKAESKPNGGSGLGAAQRRAPSQVEVKSQKQSLVEAQNEDLNAAKKEIEESLRRYDSLLGDFTRVQADLAAANAGLEQRVIERTAHLASANEEMQHKFQLSQRHAHELSERERSSLSQALHDGVCQHLAGVVMIASTLSDVCGQNSDPEMAEKLKEIATLIRSATNDARDVARALHPMDVDATGLVPALRNLVSSYDAPARTRCVLFCHEAIPVRDNDVAMHLYRIVLEAVANASRHAQARHISVHLGLRQQDIILSITDDGVGLPPDHDQSPGIGLKLMRYRASTIGATLSITARPTGGTVVRCSLPAAA